MSSTRHWRAVGVALAALALAGGATACGSDDEGSSEPARSDAPASSGGATAKLDASAVLARAYEGVIEPAPSSGPAAAPGKTIWFSNCVAFEGCARFGEGVAAAAEVLGWNVKVVDNKNDPRTSISISRNRSVARPIRTISLTRSVCRSA